jgi:outer membrane protein assembly factor BamB
VTGLPSLSPLRERRTRFAVYAAIALVLLVPVAFQAAGASAVLETGTERGDPSEFTTPPGTDAPTTGDEGTGTETGGNDTPTTEAGPSVPVRNKTGVMIAVQGYGGFGQNNGRAILVRDGEVVWQFDPPNSRVFDTELLDNGNVLVSYATKLDPEDCPDDELEYDPEECVRNNVVELDYDSKDVVWEYRWYDEFIHYHEVHDSDRLANGETAIIDMGNNRAFTVNESEEITWEWSAVEHLGPGSEFWETYDGLPEPEPESDWTHMNDIDRLANGNFLLSIRNFDVLVEVNRSTDEIVRVIGQPREAADEVEGGQHVLHEQHNPMLLGDDTVVVADSEADRIVEVNASTDEVVWTYGQGLVWPRDADRLPNGNTLVTNSLGYDVREIAPDGDVVWEYDVALNGQRGIPYEADRVALPEEPRGMPSMREIAAMAAEDDETTGTDVPSANDSPTVFDDDADEADGDGDVGREGLSRYASFVLLYLPHWIGRVELALLGGVLVVALAAVVDAAVFAGRRALERVREEPGRQSGAD